MPSTAALAGFHPLGLSCLHAAAFPYPHPAPLPRRLPSSVRPAATTRIFLCQIEAKPSHGKRQRASHGQRQRASQLPSGSMHRLRPRAKSVDSTKPRARNLHERTTNKPGSGTKGGTFSHVTPLRPRQQASHSCSEHGPCSKCRAQAAASSERAFFTYDVRTRRQALASKRLERGPPLIKRERSGV